MKQRGDFAQGSAYRSAQLRRRGVNGGALFCGVAGKHLRIADSKGVKFEPARVRQERSCLIGKRAAVHERPVLVAALWAKEKPARG
jgi:hypothetical protein